MRSWPVSGSENEAQPSEVLMLGSVVKLKLVPAAFQTIRHLTPKFHTS